MSTPSRESFNLNLLKDTPANDLSAENAPVQPTGDAGEDSGATFAAQLAGGGAEFILPTPKKSMNAGVVAFLAIAAVAGGTLWWMHQRTGGPASAEAAGQEVDAARASIQQFLSGGAGSVKEMKEMLADTGQITERFATYSENRQVPLEELKTNPFFLETGEENTPDQTGIELSRRQQQELAAREAERLRKEEERIAALAGKLQLQTVFYGKTPTAMVNGQICRVGQQLGEFTVTAIRPASIELRHGERVFELQLSAK